jgi:hypothetical protein
MAAVTISGTACLTDARCWLVPTAMRHPTCHWRLAVQPDCRHEVSPCSLPGPPRWYRLGRRARSSLSDPALASTAAQPHPHPTLEGARSLAVLARRDGVLPAAVGLVVVSCRSPEPAEQTRLSPSDEMPDCERRGGGTPAGRAGTVTPPSISIASRLALHLHAAADPARPYIRARARERFVTRFIERFTRPVVACLAGCRWRWRRVGCGSRRSPPSRLSPAARRGRGCRGGFTTRRARRCRPSCGAAWRGRSGGSHAWGPPSSASSSTTASSM